MSQSLWIAKTGLDAQQTKMATISNNLANVKENQTISVSPLTVPLIL